MSGNSDQGLTTTKPGAPKTVVGGLVVVSKEKNITAWKSS
jgi:hypothetical protein